MNTFVLIVLGFFAFILQYLLTFLQMKKFTRHYRALRREGRVAIGRYAGIIRTGVIVLLLLDEDGFIKKGQYVQGVTVFAGYKAVNNLFIGKHVSSLTEADCQAAHYSKSLCRAVLDARNSYNILTSGGVLPEKKSPFGRLLDVFKFKLVKK